MFDAIKDVTTWITLVAFIVAAVVYGFRYRAKKSTEAILSARPEDKVDAINAANRHSPVTLTPLNAQASQQYALAQLELQRMIATYVFWIAVLIVVIGGISIINPKFLEDLGNKTSSQKIADQQSDEKMNVGVKQYDESSHTAKNNLDKVPNDNLKIATDDANGKLSTDAAKGLWILIATHPLGANAIDIESKIYPKSTPDRESLTLTHYFIKGPVTAYIPKTPAAYPDTFCDLGNMTPQGSIVEMPVTIEDVKFNYCNKEVWARIKNTGQAAEEEQIDKSDEVKAQTDLAKGNKKDKPQSEDDKDTEVAVKPEPIEYANTMFAVAEYIKSFPISAVQDNWIQVTPGSNLNIGTVLNISPNNIVRLNGVYSVTSRAVIDTKGCFVQPISSQSFILNRDVRVEAVVAPIGLNCNGLSFLNGELLDSDSSRHVDHVVTSFRLQ